MLKIIFWLHKCTLDILRCISAIIAKISSWRCRKKWINSS